MREPLVDSHLQRIVVAAGVVTEVVAHNLIIVATDERQASSWVDEVGIHEVVVVGAPLVPRGCSDESYRAGHARSSARRAICHRVSGGIFPGDHRRTRTKRDLVGV